MNYKYRWDCYGWNYWKFRDTVGSRNRCSTTIVTTAIAIVQYGMIETLRFCIVFRPVNGFLSLTLANMSTNILHTVHPPISEYYFLFELIVKKKGLKKKEGTEIGIIFRIPSQQTGLVLIIRFRLFTLPLRLTYFHRINKKWTLMVWKDALEETHNRSSLMFCWNCEFFQITIKKKIEPGLWEIGPTIKYCIFQSFSWL